MQEHCGVNEVCTRQSYDQYGRPLRTWEGVLNTSTWVDSEANLLRGYTPYGASPGWMRNVVTEWRAPRCAGNFVRKLYDGLGQLIQEQRPRQNWGYSIGTTTMGYDLAGRKISMVDPDLGSWTYTYNRQNQLTRQKDGRNQYICLYYDGFERLQDKRFPSNSTCPTSGSYGVLYNYDQDHSSTNRSRGQLTYVSNGGYTKWLDYNAQGLLAEELVRITGAPQDYTTKYGYDPYSRPSTVTYPDNEVVTTSYNSMGLPRQLHSSTFGLLVTGDTNGDGDVVDPTDGANYDEAGRLRTMLFPQDGNLWQSYDYYFWTCSHPYGLSSSDSNGRLRLVYVGTNPYFGDKYGSHYSYDSHGNVTVFQEWINNATVTNSTFTYDDQNRLLSGHGKNYSYDAAGRLTGYEGANYTAYATAHPHAITDVGPNTRDGYDANGNMTTRWSNVYNGFQTLTWDVENRLSGITRVGTDESYLYDADGQRVKKASSASTTYYPNQYYEQYGGTNIDKYYYFNGQPIALSRNGGLYYLHQDQIGNMALVTSGGNRADDQGFYAYGNLRRGIIGVERGFTGQQKDFGTGLIYFKARYYDSELGTFISPDSIVPDAGNLFAYNRYLYAYGNPLKFSDPTGHCSVTGGASGRSFSAESCGGIGAIGLALSVGLAAQQGLQVVAPHTDKVIAVADGVVRMSEQAAHHAGQQNAGDDGGNTADPGGLDPNKLPKGFENVAKFREFGSTVNNGLAKAGYGDTQAIFQGSSVTGVKYTTGQPFDVGRLSDYDIALAGEKLMKAAQQIGVGLRQGGIRTEPLQDWQLAKLGLDGLAKQLSELAGRPVNFMIYQSVEAATKRAPSILIPK